MSGPLEGVRIVELGGLGPAPFCGMVLADLGADVILIERADLGTGSLFVSAEYDLHRRGKRSIAIDLKHEQGVQLVLRMLEDADALIEGFRPGVVERLGVGPAEALAANGGLVFGRMTGWGQDGPYASSAGHDIDYIAISGVLGAIGDLDSPVVPLNLIGDFGGGGMLLAVGVLAALIKARATGTGQVVDAAMVDGSALLSTSLHGFIAQGFWTEQRRSNLLDGGAPFYSVYPTADGRHMAVGALEPRFFAALLAGLEIVECPAQQDVIRWDEMRQLFADRFASQNQDFWIDRFAGTDGCVAPVRTLREAPHDPHLRERGTFVDVGGIAQPASAPRFSATPNDIPPVPPKLGENTMSILEELGYSSRQISKLVSQGAVATNPMEES